MIFDHDCDSCNRNIHLEYDESDATPAFCPFCSEDLMDDGSFIDDISIEDHDDHWDHGGIDHI